MALSHKKDCLRLYKATQSLGDVHESPTIWFFHMSMTTSRQAGRLSSRRSYRWWNRTQDLAHHMTIFFFLIGWLNELHNFGCIAGLITPPRKHTTPWGETRPLRTIFPPQGRASPEVDDSMNMFCREKAFQADGNRLFTLIHDIRFHIVQLSTVLAVRHGVFLLRDQHI